MKYLKRSEDVVSEIVKGELLAQKDKSLVALLGGNTAEFLTKLDVDVSSRDVCYIPSDEREVDKYSSRSNFPLFQKVCLKHHVRKYIDYYQNSGTIKSNKQLQLEVSTSNYHPSLAILGFGLDGHCCGLFTEEDFRKETFFVRTLSDTMEKRVSIGSNFLKCFNKILFLFYAGPKEEAIRDFDLLFIKELEKLKIDFEVYCIDDK